MKWQSSPGTDDKVCVLNTEAGASSKTEGKQALALADGLTSPGADDKTFGQHQRLGTSFDH